MISAAAFFRGRLTKDVDGWENAESAFDSIRALGDRASETNLVGNPKFKTTIVFFKPLVYRLLIVRFHRMREMVNASEMSNLTPADPGAIQTYLEIKIVSAVANVTLVKSVDFHGVFAPKRQIGAEQLGVVPRRHRNGWIARFRRQRGENMRTNRVKPL